MKKLKNKKTVIILLCVAVLAAVIALIVHQTNKLTNDSYANCSFGDVNGDGFIDAGDTLLIIQSVSDPDLLFENQKKLADVDMNGTVDASDALLLLRYTVGEISYIPYTGGSDGNAEKLKKAECRDGDLASSVQVVNEWENGDGTKSYQLNINVKNEGDSSVSDWKLNVTLNNEVQLDKKWSCNAKLEKRLLSVTGDTVPTDSAAACGVILSCEKETDLGIIEIKTVS